MRFHYLTSIAGANLAFLALVLFPFSGWLSTVWLPLTALPYFLLYGRDLRSRGYRHADVVRVYALNVLLVGANLAGVVKSLHQAVSGRPTPFKRTPKVHDRTPAPALYVFIPYAMGLYLCFAVGWDLTAERWAHATVGALNAVLIFYAIHLFIGARTSWRDLVAPFRSDTSHERVAGRLRGWRGARRAARVGGVLAPLPSLAPDTAGARAIAADIRGPTDTVALTDGMAYHLSRWKENERTDHVRIGRPSARGNRRRCGHAVGFGKPARGGNPARVVGQVTNRRPPQRSPPDEPASSLT